MKRKLLLVTGLFISAVTIASFNFYGSTSAVVPGINTLVSVNNTGNGQGGNYGSQVSFISANGKFVAFHSDATNLVSTDTNGVVDVFVRDLNANATSRVSISSAGAQANGVSQVQGVSETGRYVLFMSLASNLIDGRTVSSAYYQLYVHDRNLGTTTIVSQNASSAIANRDVSGIDISNDGRYILASSQATNLGPTIANSPRSNLFMFDRALGTVSLINVPMSGSLENVDTYRAHMNCDGSFVVFESSATNLVSGDTNGHADIFLVDRRAGYRINNITINANSNGTEPQISCNGNFVGFGSLANNIVTATNGLTITDNHAYAYDRINGTYQLLDQSTSGDIANQGVSGPDVKLSDSGNAIFVTMATNITSTSPAGNFQIYLRNVSNSTTELLSRNAAGNVANSSTMRTSMSASGEYVSYYSLASNLVPSDTNGVYDIFISETGL